MSIILSMIFLFPTNIREKLHYCDKKRANSKSEIRSSISKIYFYILSGTPIPKSSIPLFTICATCLDNTIRKALRSSFSSLAIGKS